MLARALVADPGFAAAHAAQGNLRVRCGDLAGACAAYASAVATDPAAGAYRLALAELTNLAGDRVTAQAHFAATFAQQRIFSPALPPAAGSPAVLVLLQPGPWPDNIPLDFIVDRSRVALHRWYLTADAAADARALPPYDLVLVALSASSDAAAARTFAQDFVAAQSRPVVNDPRRLAATDRPALAATLAAVAGCRVAPTARVPAAAIAALADDAGDLAGIPFPLVLRPVDAHGGRGLARAGDAAATRAHAARTAAPVYDVSAYVDYRSADGWYRKVRVMFVAGRPYPYHLCVDRAWMLHYYRTPIASAAWMRAEEAAFLSDPAAAFPGWTTTLPAIGRALGLDYAGIDCAALADGTILVFEADAAMLVHRDPTLAAFAYTVPAARAIGAALDALLADRAAAAQPFAPPA